MGTLELFDITRYVSEKNVEILRGGICLWVYWDVLHVHYKLCAD